MNDALLSEVKLVISNTVGGSDTLTDDSQLVGDLLDSLSITNLITALEENFDFIFDDDDLSAEAFETPLTVAELIASKTS